MKNDLYSSDALASAEQEEKRAEFKSDQPKPEEKKLPNDLSVVREADDVTELIKRKPIKRPADGGGWENDMNLY